jgi:DNA-binding HxlR family transcriptional regulator
MLAGTCRFTDLRDAIPDISDRMLCARLRELEAEGVVARQVSGETPVRVEYHLTDKGLALKGVVAAIGDWADRWLECPESGPRPSAGSCK